MNVRKYVLFAWNLVDFIYFHLSRLTHIKNKRGEKTIFRVRLTKYKGRTILLSDGTVIYKNDFLIKIHLHNVKLLHHLQLYSEVRRGLKIYQAIDDALPFIYYYFQEKKSFKKVKGLIGITMLHKGCRKLGFEPFPIQNQYYKLFKKTALFPIYVLSTNSLYKKTPEPMYLFMSKNNLINYCNNKKFP